MTAQTLPLSRSEWLPGLARVGVAMTLAMACPTAALVLLLALNSLRRQLGVDVARLTTGLHRDTWWPLAIVVVVAIIALAALHPFPPDDLARDLVAHFTGYDYRRMFWGSPRLPDYDPYLAFDHVAAWAAVLPSAWRALPFQTIPLLAMMAMMAAALSRCLSADLPNRRLAIAGLLLLTLSMPGVAVRIIQGRPEVDFAVWALSALVLPPRWWFVLGLALAPTYWLAPVYGAGALLLPSRDPGGTLRARFGPQLAIGLAWALAASLLWILLTDGRWLAGLVKLATAGGDRIGKVGEDETLWGLVIGSGSALLALLAWRYRHGFRASADLDLWLTLAVFMLPDMVRYTDIVSPLLVLAVARAMSRARPPAWVNAAVLRLIVAWACVFMLPLGFNSRTAPKSGFLAHVRPGDRILAPFSPILYRAAFAAVPHGGVLAPAMEVGMTRRDIQQLSLSLSEGHIDCAALHRHHVRWVVEDASHGTPPPCLRLDSTDGPTRAWSVTP